MQVVRQTFEERYNKYLKNPEASRGYINARLKVMPIEELAYILAEHDKFSRIGCAEYANDDTPPTTTKSVDASGNVNIKYIPGKTRLPDPLGREVDPWGRPIKKK